MLLQFLNFFQDFPIPIKIPLLFSFIPLLSFSFLMSFSFIPQFTNKETLPVKIPQNLPSKFINEYADLYLISTKDGYLHALNKEKKQIWKVYLEKELMSSTISTRKIDDNLYLYPIDERLYIYQDGNFISFDIFIKDLVKKQYLTVKDFILLGKTKITLFIIDVDTGGILQKIDDENNISYKKRYILSKKRNTITVVRIDYILNCLGLVEEQKFWNASYSDILIQKGNENIDNNNVFRSDSLLKYIITEYNRINNFEENNSDINKNNVITAYSYFNKDMSTIKIYDRSSSEQDLDGNKKNEINGEIQYLIEFNNKNKFFDNDDKKKKF